MKLAIKRFVLIAMALILSCTVAITIAKVICGPTSKIVNAKTKLLMPKPNDPTSDKQSLSKGSRKKKKNIYGRYQYEYQYTKRPQVFVFKKNGIGVWEGTIKADIKTTWKLSGRTLTIDHFPPINLSNLPPLPEKTLRMFPPGHFTFTPKYSKTPVSRYTAKVAPDYSYFIIFKTKNMTSGYISHTHFKYSFVGD